MSAFDYILGAVAYIYAYEREDGYKFSSDPIALSKDFADKYDHELPKEVADRVVDELDRLEFISLIRDKYAGTILQFDQDKFNSRYSNLADRSYRKFLSLAQPAPEIYLKAISNPQLWNDLGEEGDFATESDRDAVQQERIPASDRLVTVSHNSDEGQLLQLSLDQIISELETNNAIAAEAGEDRERLIAEARASRELVLGEKISTGKLQSLVLSFFQEIGKKFREKASEWSVDKVISVLLKILELLK